MLKYRNAKIYSYKSTNSSDNYLVNTKQSSVADKIISCCERAD